MAEDNFGTVINDNYCPMHRVRTFFEDIICSKILFLNIYLENGLTLRKRFDLIELWQLVSTQHKLYFNDENY
ncbi:hypothetical protein C4J81_13260 [Deltaproteobacteria bacterium Smac51]|nr:hypothetical protein C4J81_13260 [Deltaproteobacteria bacterium Smac51]